MNSAKCSKCGQMLSYVQIEPLDINRGERAAYHGVSYSCPSCRTILSVGIDPIAFKKDIIDQLRERDALQATLFSLEETDRHQEIRILERV